MGNLKDKAIGLLRRIERLPEECADEGIPLTRAGWREWRNRRRLRALAGVHHGRRAFVIGNGPSLRLEDLERLSGELTIAANKIYLAFWHVRWRPNWLCVIDEIVARNNAQALAGLALPRLFSREAARQLPPDPRILTVRTLPHPLDAQGRARLGFSDALTAGAYGGYSVIHFGLQAAAHMGVRQVYLLGVDFHFRLAPRTGEVLPMSGEVLVSQGERNHFLADYRHPGETWTFPDLERQREAYRVARAYFESHGGRLVNASRETKLDVLERADLDAILAGRA